MPSKNPNNHETRFKGKGAGLRAHTQPLAVRFPPDILETLKANPARQDFIRAAVIEKLEREALLPLPEQKSEDVAINPPAPPEPTTAKKPRGKNMAKRSDV